MNKKDAVQHLFTNEQLHLDYESNGESSGSGARLTHLNKLSYWNLTRRKGSLLCVGVVTGGAGGGAPLFGHHDVLLNRVRFSRS